MISDHSSRFQHVATTKPPYRTRDRHMCECADFLPVVHLCLTSHEPRQIWTDDSTAIACAVLTFTRSEMTGFLELA
jgi:hypothetical protein